MDAKLLATIIAIAKKESQAQAHDVTLLEQKVEAKLKEFHSKSPILETPDFYIKGGELFCKWQSGLTLSFGSVVGPQGLKGDKGDRGLTGPAGTDGVNGKNGLDGSNGRDGVDGKNGKDGKDGLDGKDGRTGPQGVRGAKGPVGLRGEQGKDGKDGERGPQGLPGLDGQDGEDGVGIQKVWVDDDYHLTMRLTSGKVVDAGYVRGKPGASGSKGGRVTGGGGGLASVASSLKWIDYVSNWSAEPTLLDTIADGEVYEYTYTNATLYRLVPSDTSLLKDSFYTGWDGSTLSNKIIDRGMGVTV